MSKVFLGDVAVERRETCKGSKDGYPIVGLEHLTPEEITLTAWNEDSENTFTKMFRKGDILFGRRRAYLKKAAVAPFDGICSGDITVIQAKPDRILPELLPFIIQNDALFDFAVGKSAGSLSPRVKWEHLKNYEFELPEMDKQRELAGLLWAMDATRKSYQRLITATDELVKSQFIERFGDEIVSECRWPVRKMKDVFTITSSKRILKSEWRTEGEIPFLRVRDMVQLANGEPLDNEFYVTEEFYNSRSDDERVRSGDIIVSATSTIGKTYIIKDGERFYFKDADVLLFRKKGVPIDEIFFTYGLGMPTVWRQVEGGLGATTVAHFLISKAEKLLQPLPPIELQEEFAAFVRQSDKSKFANLMCSNLNLSSGSEIPSQILKAGLLCSFRILLATTAP